MLQFLGMKKSPNSDIVKRSEWKERNLGKYLGGK